jgi:hypothetical protein
MTPPAGWLSGCRADPASIDHRATRPDARPVGARRSVPRTETAGRPASTTWRSVRRLELRRSRLGWRWRRWQRWPRWQRRSWWFGRRRSGQQPLGGPGASGSGGGGAGGTGGVGSTGGSPGVRGPVALGSWSTAPRQGKTAPRVARAASGPAVPAVRPAGSGRAAAAPSADPAPNARRYRDRLTGR